MPGSDPKIGDVYYYPYLWLRQSTGERAEKDRPCCVAIRLNASYKDGTNVFLLAISTSGYPHDGTGIAIPAAELARLPRFNQRKQHWLTTSEDNRTVHTSPAFVESEYVGSFSSEFMKNTVYPQIRALILGDKANSALNK